MLTAVATGTGRCGTRWLCRTLNAAGIPAGHEQVYTPGGYRPDPRIVVDVSWLALTTFVPEPTLLIAREPTGCIASLIDCGLFTDHDRYTDAVGREISLTGDPFVDACTWWAVANRRPSDARWRLDQPDRLPAALAAVGIDPTNVDPHMDRDVHPIGTRTTVVGWDDLPDHVLEVAAAWGWT